MQLKRISENPILFPHPDHVWEKKAAFNGCLFLQDQHFGVVYRAIGEKMTHRGVEMSLSTIGYVTSDDGIHFINRRQIIVPEEPWEAYGCEDPRVTYFERKYYIFYTALAHFPPKPQDITIAVAVTTDFHHFEKHHVTTFNSKAMTLFPERIDGKLWTLFSIDTDILPTCIATVACDSGEELWSSSYWVRWASQKEQYTLLHPKTYADHIEVGAPPLKTKNGWLVIYSYIYNLHNRPATFAIQALLLDLHNPSRIIGKIDHPLLVPKAHYELKGDVPNIVFPTGAIVRNRTLTISYGGADTVTCLATIELDALLDSLDNSTNLSDVQM